MPHLVPRCRDEILGEREKAAVGKLATAIKITLTNVVSSFAGTLVRFHLPAEAATDRP